MSTLIIRRLRGLGRFFRNGITVGARPRLPWTNVTVVSAQGRERNGSITDFARSADPYHASTRFAPAATLGYGLVASRAKNLRSAALVICRITHIVLIARRNRPVCFDQMTVSSDTTTNQRQTVLLFELPPGGCQHSTHQQGKVEHQSSL